MCESSIYARNRRATSRERLELRKVFGHHGRDTGHMGFYPRHARSDQPKLVCIRKTTELTVGNVHLNEGACRHFTPKQWQHVKVAVKAVEKATFEPAHCKTDPGNVMFWDIFMYSDSLIINGTRLPLYLFEIGMQVDIGERPVRKPRITGKKGMKVVEASVKEALALPPEPKPEEGEQPEVPVENQPAPQPEPVPEVPPTPTAAMVMVRPHLRRTRRG